MKTKNSDYFCPFFCPTKDKPEKVLVFSHRGEPALLSAVEVNKESILVYGDSPKKTIAYPRRYVFKMDDNLYDRLVKAFSIGNYDLLNNIWGEAVSV